MSTAEGTLLDIGPLGTDGEIRVNPVRGDLIEDEAILFAPARTIERARPARKS